MVTDEDLKSRINDKLDRLKIKLNTLSPDDYHLLSKKLWEIERETALLREYIEKNSSDDDLREAS
jgi:hypothetical protein